MPVNKISSRNLMVEEDIVVKEDMVAYTMMNSYTSGTKFRFYMSIDNEAYIYAFATDLSDPTKVIAKPSGYLLAPYEEERIGDVSNVLFCNGAVINEKNEIYIYYASSDTRLHVAKTTADRLMDYVFHNPPEMFRSLDSAKQRVQLIRKNHPGKEE